MAAKNPPRSALEHFAPNATRRVVGSIAVRAVRRGFYDNDLKEPGTVFHIQSKKELGSWMELVNADEAPAAPGKPTAGGGKPAGAGKSEDDVL